MDLVLGPRPRKFIFPIHLDRRDRRPHHLENLLGGRVPNVMAGGVVSLFINTFFFCTKCRVSECSMNTRCNECM